MNYSAVDLAEYVVKKCFDEGKPISNLQLQKILYHIQYMFLTKKNYCAFEDDIEAWKFGPVTPNAYYRFCGSGGMPITLTVFFKPYEDLNFDKKNKKLIDAIVEEKRDMNPWDMVDETHKEGSAWHMIYNGGVGDKEVIPPELIKEKGL